MSSTRSARSPRLSRAPFPGVSNGATICAACNAVFGLARERFTKNLFSSKASRQKPFLITTEDERAQVDYVVGQILAQRESGMALQDQAVLFRAASHSALLELELARR